MDINWNILNLECKTSENGLSKVVSRIQWSCIATTTHEEKEYTTEIHGPVELSSPDPNNFVAYESLTKEQVVEWLLEALGEKPLQEITAQLQSNLDEQINPTTVNLKPPFEN
jgi:hypothetical protein